MIYPIRNLEKVSTRCFRFTDTTSVLGQEIPKNFETDGASVPYLFWWFLSPFHAMFPAAIVHDFRCDSATTRRERKAADQEFYQNLKICRVAMPWRVIAYSAVRFWSIYQMFKRRRSR